MRLTINLDDDLYAMARSHAIATKTSISKAVGDLLRRRVEGNIHPRCLNWFAGIERFATCPVTEGTLLRLHMMHGIDKSPEAAWRALEIFRAHPVEPRPGHHL